MLNFLKQVGDYAKETAQAARYIPYGWVDKCFDFCDYFMPKVDEYERLITDNPIFRRRTEGVGSISREAAISWGLSGLRRWLLFLIWENANCLFKVVRIHD